MGSRGSSRGVFLTGIILINFLIDQGSSIYFSQSDVNIARTFLPDSGFLYVVKALTTQYEDGQIRYTISKPIVANTHSKGSGGGGGKRAINKCLDLMVDEYLGNISVVLPQGSKGGGHNELLQVGEVGTCLYKIVARLENSNNSTQKTQKSGTAADDDKAELNLTLHVNSALAIISRGDDAACKTLSKKEICFGGASFLDLKVMENSPVTPIAYLGSLPGMCGTLKVSYNVSVTEDVVFASETGKGYGPLQNILTSKSSLDREIREMYNMSVTCIVESSDMANMIELIQIGGELILLDENDNSLHANIGEKEGLYEVAIWISLPDHDYKTAPGTRLSPKDHSDLLAYDKDSLAVNNYEIHSVNDTKKLMNFDLITYPVSQGPFNTTAVILKIMFSDFAKDLVPWDGDYCVLVIVNDSTVISSKRNEFLKYTICVTWGQNNNIPTQATERPSKTMVLDRLSHAVTTAQIPRSTQKYAPVLYPYPDILEDVSEVFPELEFTLSHIVAVYEDDASNNSNDAGGIMMTTVEELNVFEVTPRMAIIYLLRPELIRNSSYQSFHLQLFCNTSLIPSFTTNITITLENPVSNETLCDDELCSAHSDSKICELSCGYGSPGKCMWRHEPGFNNSLSNDDFLNQSVSAPHYSTCSPRLDTCPDGKCDELEQMRADLCPQDCANKMIGFGKLIQRGNGKSYGIDGEYCKGIGTCHDATSCGCAPLPIPRVESTSHKNLPFSTTVTAGCGSDCILLYLIVAMIAVGFIILSVYVWKARVERIRKSRSLNQTVVMTANGIEMPFGDNAGHGNMFSDGDYSTRGMNHAVMLVSDDQFAQNQILQVDSKWEIPREDLLLEHILGEGQFGRVLKGRLHGHAAGHTPVAVKMLKVDAAEGSKSVWQEFMAEFSLLKQVEHPNVIKLLGACTTTGGPPYLVMEFAEYGALRSFLRKCRRVEKINGSHGALHWDTTDLSSPSNSDPLDLNYVVTPREVLGFSWQIAKGMAYLSDMKMVHRDLAARNILLTKLKVCKISDFGLTRDIYVDDAYQKKSKDRVPVKWLAPECLADELYTTKSDVWAFGVLLWELTTLGASPYPGIQSEQLYVLLNAGYRMPQPQNCSNELYSLMRRCWSYQPAIRPTFHQVVLELSKMLEDGIEYLKLDVPSISNPGYDYFAQTERSGSEMVNLSPAIDSPMADIRPMSRRKLSMENLRLIDYEISTDGEFLGKRNSNLQQHSCTRHTYVNEPSTTEQDCSSKIKPAVSSSGYESPIRNAASVAV